MKYTISKVKWSAIYQTPARSVIHCILSLYSICLFGYRAGYLPRAMGMGHDKPPLLLFPCLIPVVSLRVICFISGGPFIV